jgi:glycosyltransferase involved in cell wall biosynthesis
MPVDISVIIPTYNRAEQLVHCLSALQDQTLNQTMREIIVINDGSTDDTRQRIQSFIVSNEIRYFYKANGGPSRARNLGIRMARGKILLFLGDDIVGMPDLLAEHLAAHRRYEDNRLAVLGLTEWSEEIHASPLMKYPGLGENFDYHLIFDGSVNPENLPYNFFYTSNVSIGRQFLLDNDLFFDEDFHYAMGEDGELAYRMQEKGLRIVFNPLALAKHEHYLTFENICDRWFRMGHEAILQVKKHPEWSDLGFLNLTWKGKARHFGRKFVARLLYPFLIFFDRRKEEINHSSLHKLYKFVLEVYRFEGLLYGLHIYDIDSHRV